MRILFMSDVHMKVPFPLISKIIESENYDIALSGGDWDISVPVRIPTIYGNHDADAVFKEPLVDGLNIVKKNRVISHSPEDMDKGITVCSFGGAIIRDNFGYPKTWHEPEYYMKKYLELRDAGPFRCDVMVTHDSPNAIIQTEKRLLNGIEEYDPKFYRSVFDLMAGLLQPKIYLCGHVHSTLLTVSRIKVFDIYGPATNVPVVKHITLSEGYAIIDLDQDSVELKPFYGGESVKLHLGSNSVITRDWNIIKEL